ncbi:hypothetical protein FRC19_011872, partial [Serendipita sp. 401]
REQRVETVISFSLWVTGREATSGDGLKGISEGSERRTRAALRPPRASYGIPATVRCISEVEEKGEDDPRLSGFPKRP